jgi:chromosome segregation protein
MFLKSLELSGFKSFATRTVVNFEPGITGVVGPNGSGKSNIADAIRWVLGAQSKKAVRGSKATDVIFSGTKAKAAMGLAEVALTFDNSAKLLPYDYEEVVVTRRLYRSGDSEYLINGAKVRLLDLQHALAVAGIGAETYTVIGQGMIDRALSQSPRERRTMFEEAAGVRQFYLKRDEARRKLSETTTNLSRVEDIIKELDPRLKSLRKQANALEQREQVEASLQSAYLARYGHRYRQLSGEVGTVTARRDDLNQEFMALEGELKRMSDEVQALRGQQAGVKLAELLSEESELRGRESELRQQQSAATTAKEVAASQVEQGASLVAAAETRLQELQEHAPEQPSVAGVADAAVTEAETAVRDLTKRYEELQATLESQVGSNAALAVDAKALHRALDDLATAVAAEKPYQELVMMVETAKQTASAMTEHAGVSDLFEQAQSLLAEREQAQQALQELRLKQATDRETRRLKTEQWERFQRELKTAQSERQRLQAEQATRQDAIAQHETAEAEHASELEKLFAQLTDVATRIQAARSEQGADPAALTAAEEALDQKRKTHSSYQQELGGVNVELAKLETRLEDLVEQAKGKLAAAFPPEADSPLPDESDGSEQNIAKLERRMLELGGIDPEVTAEHAEVEERHTFLTEQAEDLTKAKADLERVIRQLEQKSRIIFRESFEKIGVKFGEYFEQLFGGGKAELTLVEPEAGPDGEEPSPTDFGVEIAATPPGKRMKSLAMLSGGERAMTSAALLFAILAVNPSPFVMLDEVDAALDEANTSRFAETLKTLSEQSQQADGTSTQFIVVTHNRDTMKAAEMLYGVTMDETGISTLLSLKLPEAEKVAAA